MTGPDQIGNYADQRANGPQGWECPRCHVINAPWVAQCPCSVQGYMPPEPTINAYYMCQMPYENKNTGTASNYNSLTPLNGYVPWPKGKGDTGDKP